jgi:hypothetical protein
MVTRALNELIARDKIGESPISNRSSNSSQRLVSSLNLCQIANALTDTGLVPRSRLLGNELRTWHQSGRITSQHDVTVVIRR